MIQGEAFTPFPEIQTVLHSLPPSGKPLKLLAKSSGNTHIPLKLLLQHLLQSQQSTLSGAAILTHSALSLFWGYTFTSGDLYSFIV